MYTLLLMSALTTGPDAVSFGGSGLFFGKSGSCSGTSSSGASCYGSCSGQSSACYGSCSGSCSGSGWRFGDRIRAFFRRDTSCYGSCSGQSYACYGSCSGFASSCQGGLVAPPFGSVAPLGGGFAAPSPAVSYAGSGCDCGPSGSVPLGSPVPIADPYSPYPAYPTYPASPTFPSPSPALPTIPGTSVPPAIPAPAEPPPASVNENPGLSLNRTTATASTAGTGPARATVVVRLPADARLFAEGTPLTLTTAERTFVTPVLPGGGEYGYTFRAEYARNGETITQTRTVGVRAGGKVSVEFVDLTAAAGPATSPGPVAATAHTTATTEADPAPKAAAGPAAPGPNPFLLGGKTPERPAPDGSPRPGPDHRPRPARGDPLRRRPGDRRDRLGPPVHLAEVARRAGVRIPDEGRTRAERSAGLVDPESHFPGRGDRDRGLQRPDAIRTGRRESGIRLVCRASEAGRQSACPTRAAVAH